MAQITAIINPGSISWWFLSLSPLLFYDRIEIDPNEIEDVLNQGDRSSFHERTARMLELILNNPEEEILYRNNQLPPRGQSMKLNQRAQTITDRLIHEASDYSLSHSSLVKASELKKALRVAYRCWIRYNRVKLSILQKDEPLYNILKKDQIPQSLVSLQKIEETHAKRIPELLDRDNQLRIVLQELVRNALLIMDLGKDSSTRVYDGLVDQFLPTIELVERLRVFHELPEKTSQILNFSLLTELYSVRLSKIRSNSLEKSNVTMGFNRALRERKRLSALRIKIAEFDAFIDGLDLKPDRALKAIFVLVKDLNTTLKHIDAVGTWAMWGTGAYLLGEILSSLSPRAKLILKTVLLNPITVKATKEFIQNYYITLSGLSLKSSSCISIIRDYTAIQQCSKLERIYKVRPNVFKFWV